MTEAVFTFDTTHHALWAEEVADQSGIPTEVIPAPAEAHARCDLALACLPADLNRLAAVLDDAGVPFRIYRSAS